MKKINLKKMLNIFNKKQSGGQLELVSTDVSATKSKKLKQYNYIAAGIQLTNAILQFAIINPRSYKFLVKVKNILTRKSDQKIGNPPNWMFSITREKLKETRVDDIIKFLDISRVETINGEKVFIYEPEEDSVKDLIVQTIEGENKKAQLISLQEKINFDTNSDKIIVLSIKDDTVKGIKTEIITRFTDLGLAFDNLDIPHFIVYNSELSEKTENTLITFKVNDFNSDNFDPKNFNPENIKIETEQGGFKKDLNDFVKEYNYIRSTINFEEQKKNYDRSSSDYKDVCWKQISIAKAMSLFSILTCISHLIIASRPNYFNWIDKDNTNYFRWIEYSITSSIMVLSIAGLAGISRSEELVPIFILTGITNILGLGIEAIDIPDNNNDYSYRLKNVRKVLFISAFITHSYPWARILWRFNTGINGFQKFMDLLNDEKIDSKGNPEVSVKKNRENTRKFLERELRIFSEISIYIKIAVYGLAGIYLLFPANMISQYFISKVTKEKYFEGEKRYIFLSMFAKSFLTWSVWFGSLGGEENRKDLEGCL